MFSFNDNEIIWIAQHRTLAKLVVIAAAILFATYAFVDWLIDPTLPALTWPWRMVGVLASLGTLPFLTNQRLHKWAPLSIALMAVCVSAVVSIIFIGIVHDIQLAIIAQMQVLMTVAVFATLRTVVRAVIPAILISFNIGLWWSGAHWEMYLLSNWLIVGAVILLLIISETAYRVFVRNRLLEFEHQQQAAIVQTSDDAIVAKDLAGRVISWNEGANRLLGYSAQEIIGQTLQALIPAERLTDEQAILDHVGKGYAVKHYETVRVCKDGTLKDVSVSVSPLRNNLGEVTGASEIARDISENKRIAIALHAKDAMFRTAIETFTDGFWAIDTTGKLFDANQAYSRQSGYSRQELLAMCIADLDATDDPYQTAARVAKTMEDGSFSFETTHRRKDGSIWPVEIVATFSPLHGGTLFVFIKDMTERKRTEEQNWRQANFDSLTGLPNRPLLFDRLSKACSGAKRSGALVAVLFADLDGFKLVNDKFGHDAGDWVLQEVARRWQACVRESDTVARLGGDEFAIVLGDLHEPAAIASMAAKLIEALQHDIALPQGSHCRVGGSIGICIYPSDATEVDVLISMADSAMYMSKAKGGNTYTFCNSLAATPATA